MSSRNTWDTTRSLKSVPKTKPCEAFMRSFWACWFCLETCEGCLHHGNSSGVSVFPERFNWGGGTTLPEHWWHHAMGWNPTWTEERNELRSRAPHLVLLPHGTCNVTLLPWPPPPLHHHDRHYPSLNKPFLPSSVPVRGFVVETRQLTSTGTFNSQASMNELWTRRGHLTVCCTDNVALTCNTPQHSL